MLANNSYDTLPHLLMASCVESGTSPWCYVLRLLRLPNVSLSLEHFLKRYHCCKTYLKSHATLTLISTENYLTLRSLAYQRDRRIR